LRAERPGTVATPTAESVAVGRPLRLLDATLLSCCRFAQAAEQLPLASDRRGALLLIVKRSIVDREVFIA
jgi:hypothetical protein